MKYNIIQEKEKERERERDKRNEKLKTRQFL
jgi:hypothetical protein